MKSYAIPQESPPFPTQGGCAVMTTMHFLEQGPPPHVPSPPPFDPTVNWNIKGEYIFDVKNKRNAFVLTPSLLSPPFCPRPRGFVHSTPAPPQPCTAQQIITGDYF